ncbi:thiamine pyrophosphate-binding protein [Pseudonocardia sp. MH-G8]|uniref:thiamine pyrophosphate-binding protein n=1 Tax=Pseudonocardia sp. MH-G8 TaxID=1854588 RepID=UPI000BA0ABF2|nr:thiamine pyrophosphate-binding protein [Pseudonocardia sp. MH-G8]OZM81991.1 thiamine pyrophosphate-binding protein [Pseudonocardia sp. MH-G8]
MTDGRTGGRLVVDQLRSEGVDTAFCVPGESYLEVLDALHGSGIRLVTCRHEGGAGYMADAYARITGTVGVALVTRGPGAANAAVALHTAWQDSTPLVLLVGLVPRGQTGREAFQEFDLQGWFGTTAKAVHRVDDAARVPELLAGAFATARSGRPGPVVVGLPEDVLRERAAVGPVAPVEVTEPVPAPATMARFAGLVRDATRPLVVLGGVGWSPAAADQARRWAERFALPVAVEFNALDLIDHDSPSYVGCMGFGRPAELTSALREADLVIGIGSPLGDVVTDGWELLPVDAPGARLVTVLPDAEARGSAHPDALRIVATAPAFTAALDDLAAPEDPGWAERTRLLRKAHEEWRVPRGRGADLDLDEVFGQLRDHLPDDAIVTWGAGNHCAWPSRFLSRHGYPSQLAPRNGSMGYGVPAAVAAAIAHPQRPVVSIAGDGCFLMNGQELATARAQGVAPLVLVLDNGTYGTIRAHQEQRHPGRVSGTDLVNPDFAALVRAYGGHGETVTRTAEFVPALERAMAAGVPALIALRVTDGTLAPGVTVADLRAT